MLNLPKKGKILALDLGTRKTGVSITDNMQRVAFLREEIRHNNFKELQKALIELIEKEKIAGLLIGLPTKLDRKETKQTEITKETVEKLDISLPIQFADERLTSKFAKLNPLEDSRSAQIMLERYLDQKK